MNARELLITIDSRPLPDDVLGKAEVKVRIPNASGLYTKETCISGISLDDTDPQHPKVILTTGYIV